MSADVDIDQWLGSEGFGLPIAKAKARAVLEEAGLTRPGKLRLSTEKLPRAQQHLTAHFFLHCPQPECASFAAQSGREPLPCLPTTACERCGGSANVRATRDLRDAFHNAGLSKLLIVGGSPATREELQRLLPPGGALEVRLVDGTQHRPAEKARADLEWADLCLVWGASELHHKVSKQYTDAPAHLAPRMVHVTKRGIAQLLAEAVSSVTKRR